MPGYQNGQKEADPGGRPGWDEYFLGLAELAATRSTCLRRRVGALLVADRRVLATGYNGPPRGLAHCREAGCLREDFKVPSGQRHEICRAIHAEQNAILQAAHHGVLVRQATLYCTHQPCAICARLMLNLDITRLVLRGAYPDELALDLFREGGFFREESGEGPVVWTKKN
ncbi:MAG: cytidine/deoxycytidylate deaminase family protein [Deltaproteobacteria bacterium]|nr:cytidine/deoxycytidylate deaminase family protein [Deltaproteobacteria bacterium]